MMNPATGLPNDTMLDLSTLQDPFEPLDHSNVSRLGASYIQRVKQRRSRFMSEYHPPNHNQGATAAAATGIILPPADIN